MKPTDPRSAYRLQRILDLLLEKDLDQKQITDALCMSDPRGVAAYLTYMRGRQKTHVCGWRNPSVNGHRWPIYRFGKGQNVPKPAPKTQAEITRAYWRRKGRGTPHQSAQPFDQLFKP